MYAFRRRTFPPSWKVPPTLPGNPIPPEEATGPSLTTWFGGSWSSLELGPDLVVPRQAFFCSAWCLREVLCGWDLSPGRNTLYCHPTGGL